MSSSGTPRRSNEGSTFYDMLMIQARKRACFLFVMLFLCDMEIRSNKTWI